MEHSFIPQVSLVITRGEEYLLLTRHPITGDQLSAPIFPTGKLKAEEGLQEGALRLAQELAGLEIEVDAALSIYYMGGPIFFNFWATTQGNGQASDALVWVSKQELAAMVTEDSAEHRRLGSPGSLQIAKDILEGKHYSLALFEPFA